MGGGIGVEYALGERFVVGDLQNDGGDFLAEQTDQFRLGRFGIFKRVVQDRRDENTLILDERLVGKQVRQRNGVIDVGRGFDVLAALVAVAIGCKSRCRDQFLHGSLGLNHQLSAGWCSESTRFRFTTHGT